MEAAQREDGACRNDCADMRLRGSYVEGLEPALEFLREAGSGGNRRPEETRRKPALTVNELDADASIGVVPPVVFGPLWERGPAFLFYKKGWQNIAAARQERSRS